MVFLIMEKRKKIVYLTGAKMNERMNAGDTCHR